ncbi:excisionase family DNA binding protein [Microbacterium sp. AK009]|uniref:helix-turn-helix domain-containing protein n=1 Tax=Microbacterium sp. AK009 TaxID=2723068 RepID=UPI0015CBE26B|nr:helix-turn-helix domain-containing protein [Microbacterium sp. AK009]NYF16003.1 excisionase family DNA binding protein [Microbacterium sp. AK009]
MVWPKSTAAQLLWIQIWVIDVGERLRSEREDELVEHGDAEKDRLLSPIQLNPAQTAVLAWIVDHCPEGVYSDDSFAHRITARALKNRGLVEISGRGATWRAVPTARGLIWPRETDSDFNEREAAGPKVYGRTAVATSGIGAESDDGKRALRQAPARSRPKKSVNVKQVNKQEIYVRYKVVVTRVQLAERWIRATDEEDAARKVREEFAKPYAYFGHWETKGSEIEVVEAEQTTVIKPNLLDESGPMLLSLKDAAGALGIPYSALYELTNRGDIEFTRIGSRKYIARESLMSFIRENTHRGYSPS